MMYRTVLYLYGIAEGTTRLQPQKAAEAGEIPGQKSSATSAGYYRYFECSESKPRHSIQGTSIPTCGNGFLSLLEIPPST